MLCTSPYSHCTPWEQMLSWGRDNYFLVSTNFTSRIVMDALLPLFKEERAQYLKRKGQKVLGTEYLLGILLWYVKIE